MTPVEAAAADAVAAVQRASDAVDLLTNVAAVILRRAVDDFNTSELSVASVDMFRSKVLHVADVLGGAPLGSPTTVGDARLAGAVGLRAVRS